MRQIIFFVALVITSSNDAWSNHSPIYKIIGHAYGIPDNTRLYLDDISSSTNVKNIDSTIVLNNQFEFSGMLQANALYVMIRSDDSRELKNFWLENGTLYVDIKKGKFGSAKVTGSTLQSEQDRIDSLLHLIELKRGNIYKKLRKKMSNWEKQIYATQLKELEKRKYEELISFIKSHRDTELSAFLINMHGQFLNTYDSHLAGKNLRELCIGLSKDVKESVFGRDVYLSYIEGPSKIRPGDHFFDFEQENMEGKLIKLSQILAQPNWNLILLEFWASRCGPCRKENPNLLEVYNDFKEKGFQIVAVSLDKKKEDWIQAVKYDRLIWENVCDFRGMKNDAVQKYGVVGIPMNFLINKDGVVIDINLRGDALRKRLEELYKTF